MPDVCNLWPNNQNSLSYIQLPHSYIWLTSNQIKISSTLNNVPKSAALAHINCNLLEKIRKCQVPKEAFTFSTLHRDSTIQKLKQNSNKLY